MQAIVSFSLIMLRMFAAVLLMAAPAQLLAQENFIAVDLVAEANPVAGEELTVALRFRPQEGWHGYWSNPGEAGLGMELEWQLPEGWEAGAAEYPVPEVLELFGIVNHAYKGDYTVLVPLAVPQDWEGTAAAGVTVDAFWLACTDELCVPESATLTLRYPQQSEALRSEFDAARAAIPPLIDSAARFALTDRLIRIAVPLPEALELSDPHAFVAEKNTVDYGAEQRFFRVGNDVVIEIPRHGLRGEPGMVSGILAFGSPGEGITFEAVPGDVPSGGEAIGGAMADSPLLLLLGGALLGGLLLNLMPCVFPILSLKALTLARAGESELLAKREGVAYTAGVVLACLALGALMLALRAAGEQIGWAFQLQQPLVVAALLVLAVLITANFAGLFELPSLPVRSNGGGGAFATGLLAAIAATPCTGPFMAAALGAALLLPTPEALLLFAALGFGLAFPFLLLGFVPALRNRLPKPGPWMATFRKIMAVPMGLTALALIWLAWRLGGVHFAFSAAGAGVTLVALFATFARAQPVMKAVLLIIPAYFLIALPFRIDGNASQNDQSVLDPVPFSAQSLAEARASGAPVFVWLTADWCVTCKVNEGVAIEREATRVAFEEAGVVGIRGDWTRPDPEITRYLEEWGAAGVPLYIWYPAGEEGEQLPQVLTPDTLVELAEES